MEQELRKNEEVKKEIERNRGKILYRQELQDRKTDLRRQKEVTFYNISILCRLLLFTD
jgi:hypothetical protein